MTVYTYSTISRFNYYDDFEDNKYTGRSSPRLNWTNGTSANPGTTAISSTSPLEGTYSLTHVGGGLLSHYDRAYITHPIGAAGFGLEFKMRCVTQGTVANTPAGMVFVEYYDGNNFTAMEWYYDGANTVLRIKQRIAGSHLYYGTMNWFAGKMGTGTTYDIYIRRTSTTMRIIVNGVDKITANVPALGSAVNQFGVSGQYDTKMMYDKILFRKDVSNALYDGNLATYSGFYAEQDYSAPIQPSTAPGPTNTLLTFDKLDFPFQIVITKPDGTISKTKTFIPVSTNSFQLGYEGLDKYMALRLRVYVQCTTDAKFNIKYIAFTSE